MRLSLAFLISLLTAFVALADTVPLKNGIPEPHIADNGGEPHVYFVHSHYQDHPQMAGLDDLISVHVQNFQTLLDRVDGNCSAIVLFIGGMAIKGVKAESCDVAGGHVRYRLLRTEEADPIWHALLGRPSGFTRSVNVSVGKNDQFPISSSHVGFKLEVIPRVPFYIFLLANGAALLCFIYLCRETSLIRNSKPGIGVKQQPYSLALFQMAFWFFVVISAYVFIWLICDELDTITDSVLGLAGIGAATAIGATVIDKNKASLDSATTTSRGFVRDLVSDLEGVSLHRFQMFVWTLVLGVIFFASVYANLAMPEFSGSLLGLMGISSGTYLGFKVPENAAPSGDAPPAAPPPSA